MLAWITPEEGGILKKLGGSGKPGPMGIPAYPGGYGGEGMGSFGDSADAGNIGSTDEDEDQDVAQDVARAYATPEEERSWVDKSLINAYENQNFQEEGNRVTGVDLDPKGRVTGYTKQTTPFGTAGLLANLLGITPEVYTGFGRQPPNLHGDDDDSQRGIAPMASPPAAAPVAPTTPDSYYSRGVGSETIDMNDPVQRELYLRRLYAQTPSPTGSDFKNVFNIRKGRGEKRMRGLDIFKPVSTL